MGVRCPGCGDQYEAIGQHWRRSHDCTYPGYSDRQEEILKGILLNRGHLDFHTSKNPIFEFICYKLQFVEWLRKEFGILSLELEEQDRREEDNYSQQITYRFRLRANPHLNSFDSWYGSDGREVPTGTELTPLMGKIWFALGASLNWKKTSPKAGSVLVAKENNISQLSELLTEQGFDNAPDWSSGKGIYMNTTTTEGFLTWVGGPPPGYNHKWCTKDYNLYQFGSPNDDLDPVDPVLEETPWRPV